MTKQIISGTQLLFTPYQVSPAVTELIAKPKLEELQKAVGGYLEQVPGFRTIEHKGAIRPCWALCNEDGKRLELPVNNWATMLWDRALRRSGHPGLITPSGRIADWLVGNVLIIFGNQALMRRL